MANRVYPQSYITSYSYQNRTDPPPPALPGAWSTGGNLPFSHQFINLRTEVVRVKGFSQIIKSGGNASTIPYDSTFRSLKVLTQATGRPWTFSVAGYKVWTGFTGFWPSVTPQAYSPNYPPYAITAARSGAYIRFAKALKGKRQEMSGMTFLGEFRETVKLILSPGKATQKYFSGYLTRIQPLQGKLRLARLDPKRIGRILKEASDLWLEVSFGVSPLLNDVKSLAESIARWRIDRLSPIVRGSFGDQTVGGVTSPPFTVGSTWTNFQTHAEEVVEWRYTVYGRLRAVAQLPACGSAAKLAQVLGFSAEDFFPTVYELAPFSFLLDYFTNLGGVIEAASVDTSWIDWANEVLILKGTVQGWTSISAAPGAEQYVSGTGDTMAGSALVTYKHIERRHADFSAPTVVSRMPGLGNQFANMLALIAQVQKGR